MNPTAAFWFLESSSIIINTLGCYNNRFDLWILGHIEHMYVPVSHASENSLMYLDGSAQKSKQSNIGFT